MGLFLQPRSPHTALHTEFGCFALKGEGKNTGELQKLGSVAILFSWDYRYG